MEEKSNTGLKCGRGNANKFAHSGITSILVPPGGTFVVNELLFLNASFA